tara:strand:- start:44 stop:733 length:690 start_codon:yes stop_codon:yes gene_type:complete
MNAFLYARSNSSRLPKKCFKKIYGSTTLIEHMIGRAKLAFDNENIYLLTSDSESDTDLRKTSKKHNIKLITGSLNNVIDRTIKAIHESKSEFFSRINCDSPFFPYYSLRQVIKYNKEFDMISSITTNKRLYGVGIECIKSKFFLNSLKKSEFPINKENIFDHIYNDENLKSKINFCKISKPSKDINYKKVHFENKYTVDNYKDLENIREIFLEIEETKRLETILIPLSY